MTSPITDTLKIAIAGSTDDGKSTLIGRLLIDSGNTSDDQLQAIADESRRLGRPTPEIAWLTDGLSTEQAKRITIDVAYRTIRWKGYRLQLIDTPGHLEYIRNTATGLSQADILVLLIDITRDITPQTIRHLQLANMFDIRHITVLVNKMDTVDYRQSEFEAFVSRKFLPACSHLLPADTAIIPGSALQGHNIVHTHRKTPWYHGPTLMEYVLRHADAPGMDPIASTEYTLVRVYWTSPDKIYTGIKLLTGRLHTADSLFSARSSHLKIKGIYRNGQPVSILNPGQMAVITHEPHSFEAGSHLLSTVQWDENPCMLRISALITDTIDPRKPHRWHTQIHTAHATILGISHDYSNPPEPVTTPHVAHLHLEVPLHSPGMSFLMSRGLLLAPDGRLVAITGRIHPASGL